MAEPVARVVVFRDSPACSRGERVRFLLSPPRRALFGTKQARHAIVAALHRSAAPRHRSVRVCGGSARGRADAALVHPRPRSALEPDRGRRAGSADAPHRQRVGRTHPAVLQPHAAGRAAARARPVLRIAGHPRRDGALPAHARLRGNRAGGRRPAADPLGRRALSRRHPPHRRRGRRPRLARARPRHELRRAAQRGDAPVPLLFLHRARCVGRAHHRGDRADLVARLGPRPPLAPARRRNPAAVGRRDGARSSGRSRATCAS